VLPGREVALLEIRRQPHDVIGSLADVRQSFDHRTLGFAIVEKLRLA
jgi:hypothetical protein